VLMAKYTEIDRTKTLMDISFLHLFFFMAALMLYFRFITINFYLASSFGSLIYKGSFGISLLLAYESSNIFKRPLLSSLSGSSRPISL